MFSFCNFLSENILAILTLYHSQQLDLSLMLKCIQHIICYCLDAQLQQKWLWLMMENFGMYIEDITRWREDMNVMFEWQEQYLTSERSERVRYCSCHENITFMSSSQLVMFFLLYGETNSTEAKGGNCDFIERYDTHKGDIRKIRQSRPGWSGVWNLRVV